MKILTILGTRPEIIRLSRIIPKLYRYTDHRILHTGQNYDHSLNEVFFNELGIRVPDEILDIKNISLAEQLSRIFVGVENYIKKFKPDRVLILGDTNSGLSAIICERFGIPVFHMEAGNRCFDLKVPEEKNRKLIDAISTINMPYTINSKNNLLKEGINVNKIFVTGNPIKEVLDFYENKIEKSTILENLNLKKNNFLLVTAHREENVDNNLRLQEIFNALNILSNTHTVIFSCHPRTRQNLQKFNIDVSSNIMISNPFGFFDFVKLEKNCLVGITDSGTVQEELCLFQKPTITIRDSTERPETIECGSNIISGVNCNNIINSFKIMKNKELNWNPPEEYLKSNVSDTVINIILGKL